MRRVILLMTVVAVVLVSALVVVVSAGAHQHQPGGTHQHPTIKVLIENFRLSPAKITIKRGSGGHLDQQGQRSAHRHGKQRKIVRLQTLGAKTEVFAHLQERGEEILPL